MISMGSFCTDKPYKGRILGVDQVVTLDKRMFDRFQNHYEEIRRLFKNMVTTLEMPYANAALPEIQIPH